MGKLIVISGASGVGKSTVLSKVMKSREDLKFSVSATTRAPRPGEVDGVSYYFVTRERFEEMIAAGETCPITGLSSADNLPISLRIAVISPFLPKYLTLRLSTASILEVSLISFKAASCKLSNFSCTINHPFTIYLYIKKSPSSQSRDERLLFRGTTLVA